MLARSQCAAETRGSALIASRLVVPVHDDRVCSFLATAASAPGGADYPNMPALGDEARR